MPKRGRKGRVAPIKGRWDILPHGMGVSLTAGSEEIQFNIPTPPIAESLSSTEPRSVGQRLSSIDSTQTTVAITPEKVISGATENPSLATQSTQLDITEDDTMPQSTRRKIVIKIKVPKQADIDEVLESNGDLAPEPKTSDEKRKTENTETDLVQKTGRQLRPRKPKLAPGVSKIDVDSHDSAVVEPIAGGQSDKGAPNKRKRGPEPSPITADEGLDPDTPLPKLKKVKSQIVETGEGYLKSIAKKTKDNQYGLMPPGESPFPQWLAPSAEQCEEVHNLLTKMHGEVKAPKAISAPSLEVMGCGEVPSVLDGLLRTLLSGATRIEHIDITLIPLAEKYGVSKEGVGKESINWNNVRLGSYKDLVDAIHSGGLANIKAKHIKAILDMVYQENAERRKACLQIKVDTLAGKDANEQKDAKIQGTDQDDLSLEHLRGLSKHEILKELTKYPGIGVKTAACVILFCFQIPCIAVDTHVYRFSKWLGWVPKNANVTDVFSHLEVHCPDHLKYGLHQLFIRHGQRCGKCSSSTAEGTADWEMLPECPLESLLDRYDKKQSKAKSKPAKKGKQKDEEQDEKQDEKRDEEKQEGPMDEP
ncbi:DNA glycosylase [Daldinia vernicosa]|uniref:DNA glycosylase n=1 Tax=Daldinia vernicosa TaxID=114800 RepID=UPI002007FFBD|nr:DNA glycosylase [Daldinia vernicosa]KAI0847626.1 DNA glycosylase [Daldinia vernicosa]